MSEEATQPEVSDRPEWLPENFKTPEALVKSYKELQSAFTRETQSKSELEQRVEEFEARQPKPRPARSERLASMQALADQAAQNAVQRAIGSPSLLSATTVGAEFDNPEALTVAVRATMAAKHQDWEAYEPTVAAVLRQNPELVPERLTMASLSQFERGLDVALELARGHTAAHQLRSIREAEGSRLAKLQAQTLTGEGGRPNVDPNDDESHFQAMLKAHRSNYAAVRADS